MTPGKWNKVMEKKRRNPSSWLPLTHVHCTEVWLWEKAHSWAGGNPLPSPLPGRSRGRVSRIPLPPQAALLLFVVVVVEHSAGSPACRHLAQGGRVRGCGEGLGSGGLRGYLPLPPAP